MTRQKVIITGANGGMGRACARLFANAHDLVLTDLDSQQFDGFITELRDEGYSVEAHAGDLSSDTILAGLSGSCDGRPFTLIHTAGIGPSQGDWRTIMRINLIAVEKLLRAVEPQLAPGSCAVLIASMASHMMPLSTEIASLLADPLQSGFLDKVAPFITEIGGQMGPNGEQDLAYVFSKTAVRSIAELRAEAWGTKGARINSISPGVIMTPMGRREPAAAAHGDAAALRRRGTPMDIALAAQFLVSDAAAYVTGTDLRVDGGSIAVERMRSGR